MNDVELCSFGSKSCRTVGNTSDDTVFERKIKGCGRALSGRGFGSLPATHGVINGGIYPKRGKVPLLA